VSREVAANGALKLQPIAMQLHSLRLPVLERPCRDCERTSLRGGRLVGVPMAGAKVRC
jgi:hypothetical protein